jgi:hypothetical protein
VLNSVEQFLDPIRRLQCEIRDLVLAGCQTQSAEDLAQVVHDGAGDVTYAIDRISESALVHWIDREIASREPIVLVGEGLPDGCITLPTTARSADARWRIIVDPIDGTRGLMYQKRPGWVLIGVARNRGPATSLADIELAVQTELPLAKQHQCDQLWAIRGQGAKGVRFDRLSGESIPLVLRPSSARDLRNGFATICRFFPGGRDLLGALDDSLCERLLGQARFGEAAVFTDQYACTGGQLYGLIMGQDRLVADLRPLVAPIVIARGRHPGHFCHPYDLCTKLIAEEAGVIVTGPQGGQVMAPLDTESDVAWVGYANRHLHAAIEPVLWQLIEEFGMQPLAAS